MFFKPKPVPPEWSHLTPLEIKLCRKAQKKGSRSARYEVFAKAVQEKAYGALPIILLMTGSGTSGYTTYADDAIRDTLQSNDPRCLEAIIPVFCLLTKEEQFYALSQTRLADYPDQLPQVLDQITDKDTRARAAYKFITRCNGGDKASFLCQAYLEAGINAHYESGDLMMGAVQRGQFDLASKLLECGFDVEAFGKSVYQKLVGAGAPPEAIRWYRETLAEKGIPLSATQNPSLGAEFKLVGDNGVKIVEPLGLGSTLTRVFNFSSGDQVMYVSEGERLSPPATTSLSAMDNRQLLQSAIKAFIDQGGEEALVAPYGQMTPIKKTRLGTGA